ncbi:MAG: M6 family metalloprotease domain-containing protein, partial [Bacteroidales bacterium]|nr:M6 family metalloprotease domain-containing protein [Bacteroidales bacterium]
MKKIYTLALLVVMSMVTILPVSATEKNKGELANIVCFVRFLGEDNSESFELSASTYNQMFNDDTAGANSVYNYFYEASYGQLQWRSTMFPAPQGDVVMSYETMNDRNYYKEKSSIAPNGYEDEIDRAAREQALVKEIAAYLSANLPDDVVLDANGDGIIDNMCIVLSGRSEISNRHLLWPHRTDLALPDEKAVYIKDKKLVGFLMVFDDANGWASLEPIPFNTGVICHEMSHSLGTYDLYHVADNLNPVGEWDLMADNLLVPQQMSAYTKYRYCGWIDEIPEITEPGTYTLNPVGGAVKENIAYKIKMIGSDEYFVVEYRKKEGTFDAGLPQSGLLVYRINPAYTGGNVSYNGTTRLDEVYIFRPGGTTTADGYIEKAAFSVDNGRATFGGVGAEVKPFYSNGSE